MSSERNLYDDEMFLFYNSFIESRNVTQRHPQQKVRLKNRTPQRHRQHIRQENHPRKAQIRKTPFTPTSHHHLVNPSKRNQGHAIQNQNQKTRATKPRGRRCTNFVEENKKLQLQAGQSKIEEQRGDCLQQEAERRNQRPEK